LALRVSTGARRIIVVGLSRPKEGVDLPAGETLVTMAKHNVE